LKKEASKKINSRSKTKGAVVEPKGGNAKQQKPYLSLDSKPKPKQRQRHLKPIDEIKLEAEVKKPKPVIPSLRRVREYDNGYELYLTEGRKVSVFQDADGGFVVETKRTLKGGETFRDFSPVRIKNEKKWGTSLAACRLNLSKDAILAVYYAMYELLAKEKIKT
jgi:hypothetical protein